MYSRSKSQRPMGLSLIHSRYSELQGHTCATDRRATYWKSLQYRTIPGITLVALKQCRLKPHVRNPFSDKYKHGYFFHFPRMPKECEKKPPHYRTVSTKISPLTKFMKGSIENMSDFHSFSLNILHEASTIPLNRSRILPKR
jgi:hypothetical protein